MNLKTAISLAATHGGRVTLNMTFPDGSFIGVMERQVEMTDKLNADGQEGFFVVEDGRQKFVPWCIVTSWRLILVAEGRVDRPRASCA